MSKFSFQCVFFSISIDSLLNIIVWWSHATYMKPYPLTICHVHCFDSRSVYVWLWLCILSVSWHFSLSHSRSYFGFLFLLVFSFVRNLTSLIYSFFLFHLFIYFLRCPLKRRTWEACSVGINERQEKKCKVNQTKVATTTTAAQNKHRKRRGRTLNPR